MKLVQKGDCEEPTKPSSLNRILILSYLAVPCLIFLFAFIIPALSLPSALLLIAALFISLHHRHELSSLHSYSIAIILSLCVLFVIGFPKGPFPWDWLKHWALLETLVNSNWPVILDIDNKDQYLRYYIGSYLFPALTSKITAIPVWLTYSIWILIGFVLVLVQIMSPQEKNSSLHKAVAAILFLAVAGADTWAFSFYYWLDVGSFLGFSGFHFEWWFKDLFYSRWQFSSVISNLIWVPHQSIATFLVASILLYDRGPGSLATGIVAFGLLSLWSPFGMIGLLPLMCLRALSMLPQIFNRENILAIIGSSVFALIITWYLFDGAQGDTGELCLFCTPISDYILFLLVELAFFIVLLRGRLFTDSVCLTSLLTLIILPLVAGDYPDIIMRVSLGPIFVLSARSVETVVSIGRSVTGRVIVALMFSLPTVFGEITYQLQSGKQHAMLSRLEPMTEQWYYSFHTYSESTMKEFIHASPPEFIKQYFSLTPPYPIKKRSQTE